MLRTSIYIYIGLSGISLFFDACKKDKEVPIDKEQYFKYEYFPVNVNHYVIYQVDSTVYDDYKDSTFHYRYQIKELIQSTYTDNSKHEAQRVERYYRANDTLAWTIRNVWFCNRTDNTAERVEENQRFVKIRFPAKQKLVWNGNAYNAFGEANYEITAIDMPAVINGKSFDKTLTVGQLNDSNLVYVKNRYEMYAYHVGLVEKAIIDVGLKYMPPLDTTQLPVPTRSSGYAVYYSVISYGN